MPPPDTWYLLSRYVTGDASDAEQHAVGAWVKDNPKRQELLKQVEAIYEAGGEEAVEEIDVEAAWQQVSTRIEEAEEAPARPRRVDRRPTVRDRARRTRRHVVAAVVAAAILAIALIPMLLAEPQPEAPWRMVTTAAGEQATVELYDGTVVRLNSGSTLHYPPSFEGAEERRIELDGEAYVEAVSLPDFPLIVEVGAAPHTEARVIGTSFLVTGYAADGFTRVAVSEGAVVVSHGATDPEVLNANDVAEVRADGEFAVTRGADLTAYLSWMEGRLVFDDTPLREAAAAIGRRYDISIQLVDAALSDRTITATFGRSDTLDEVLDVLARTLDLHIERAEEAVVLSPVPSE